MDVNGYSQTEKNPHYAPGFCQHKRPQAITCTIVHCKRIISMAQKFGKISVSKKGSPCSKMQGPELQAVCV